MKKHDDDIAVVVNDTLVHVNPHGQEDYETRQQAKKARKRAERTRALRHTVSDQVCFLVDNEYVCVDRH